MLVLALPTLVGCAITAGTGSQSSSGNGSGSGTQSAPIISGVTSGSVSGSSAIITWTTDKPSDSQVEFGTTTAYGSSTPVNGALVTSHSTPLSGLQAATLYHYRVKSRDAAGTLSTSGDFTFTTSAASGGKSYYVDINFPGGCSDLFSGAQNLPWCTVGNAAKVVQPGDTVIVKAGVYHEQVTPNSGTANAYISYQGQPGAILDGTGTGTTTSGFNVDGKSYVRISGFEIRNFLNNRLPGIHIFNNAHHIEVLNVLVHDNWNGIVMQNDSHQITINLSLVYNARYCVGFENTVHDIFIDQVVAHSCKETYIGSVSSYGNGDGFSADSGTYNIFIQNSTAYDALDGGFDMTTINFTCTNCESYLNGKYGFRLQQGPNGTATLINSLAFGNGWYPLQVDSNGDKALYGSTFVNTSGDRGYSIEPQGNSTSNLTIRNCIFADYSNRVFLSSIPALDEDYNLFHSAGTTPGFSPGPHSLLSDPQFVNRAAGDFHLKAGSPAIDAGTPLPQTSPDLGGVTRPQGAGYDIGAFEFTASPVADTTGPTVWVWLSPSGTLSSSTKVTFNVIAYDLNGIASIEIFVDGASKRVCSGATTCSFASTFPSGTHTFSAVAKDPAGNAAQDPTTGNKSFTVQ